MLPYPFDKLGRPIKDVTKLIKNVKEFKEETLEDEVTQKFIKDIEKNGISKDCISHILIGQIEKLKNNKKSVFNYRRL